MTSWASIVKKGMPIRVPAPLKAAPAPVKGIAPLPCVDCLRPALMCSSCRTRGVMYLEEHTCAPCYVRHLPSDSMCQGYMDDMKATHEGYVPARCSDCLLKRPWISQDQFEEVGFHYVPACFCHPMSETNRIRIPHRARKAITPTMIDIMNGRSVTGMEFLNAVALYREAVGYVQSESVSTDAILSEELELQILAETALAHKTQICVQQAQRMLGTCADDDAISESGFTTCSCTSDECSQSRHDLAYFDTLRKIRRAWRLTKKNTSGSINIVSYF